jgi:hypothetical protein
MNRRLRLRTSILLIALLLFAQASVAAAACQMDRGALGPMLEMVDGCGGCDTEFKPYSPQYANRCVAHCTADLQLSGVAVALARSPADAPLLTVFPADRSYLGSAGLAEAPPGAPPRRILLHSFLI